MDTSLRYLIRTTQWYQWRGAGVGDGTPKPSSPERRSAKKDCDEARQSTVGTNRVSARSNYTR